MDVGSRWFESNCWSIRGQFDLSTASSHTSCRHVFLPRDSSFSFSFMSFFNFSLSEREQEFNHKTIDRGQ